MARSLASEAQTMRSMTMESRFTITCPYASSLRASSVRACFTIMIVFMSSVETQRFVSRTEAHNVGFVADAVVAKSPVPLR
jgi:hypothetical protein